MIFRSDLVIRFIGNGLLRTRAEVHATFTSSVRDAHEKTPCSRRNAIGCSVSSPQWLRLQHWPETMPFLLPMQEPRSAVLTAAVAEGSACSPSMTAHTLAEVRDTATIYETFAYGRERRLQARNTVVEDRVRREQAGCGATAPLV